MSDFQGLMMEPEGSDDGASKLPAPLSDPESQSWSKCIPREYQQVQTWLDYVVLLWRASAYLPSPSSDPETHSRLLEFFLNTTFCLWVPWVVLWNTLRRSEGAKGKNPSMQPTQVNRVIYATKAGASAPRFALLTSWMSPHAEELTEELWQRALHVVRIDRLFQQNFKQYSSTSSAESAYRKEKLQVGKSSSGSRGACRRWREQQCVSGQRPKREADDGTRGQEGRDTGSEGESNAADDAVSSSVAKSAVGARRTDSSDSSKRNVLMNIRAENREKKVFRRKKHFESLRSGGEAVGGESDDSSKSRGRADTGKRQHCYMFRGSDRESSDTKYVLRKMEESKKLLSVSCHVRYLFFTLLPMQTSPTIFNSASGTSPWGRPGGLMLSEARSKWFGGWA
ncbi:hypothetical protein EVAR_39838_1 [Eumeta japonica]|uniref:Uncharacterized protein n=1 Tax=Eumeta variegata TaxID=151549 RepID=A0A4C1X7C5_EUMVA|nr:hypothetical protein EVAR_39838_1 [Eumeta japonica]